MDGMVVNVSPWIGDILTVLPIHEGGFVTLAHATVEIVIIIMTIV